MLKEDLTNDLIDLGLPKENCEILSKSFEQNHKKLEQVLLANNFLSNLFI
jgi:hypothetical protein